jgi:hypothetical protein
MLLKCKCDGDVLQVLLINFIINELLKLLGLL